MLVLGGRYVTSFNSISTEIHARITGGLRTLTWTFIQNGETFCSTSSMSWTRRMPTSKQHCETTHWKRTEFVSPPTDGRRVHNDGCPELCPSCTYGLICALCTVLAVVHYLPLLTEPGRIETNAACVSTSQCKSLVRLFVIKDVLNGVSLCMAIHRYDTRLFFLCIVLWLGVKENNKRA